MGWNTQVGQTRLPCLKLLFVNIYQSSSLEDYEGVFSF